MRTPMAAVAPSSGRRCRSPDRQGVKLLFADEGPGIPNSGSCHDRRIVGAVLAPDKGLATLPISVCVVIGMWFGTLPIGMAGAPLRPAAARIAGYGVRRAVRA